MPLDLIDSIRIVITAMMSTMVRKNDTNIIFFALSPGIRESIVSQTSPTQYLHPDFKVLMLAY